MVKIENINQLIHWLYSLSADIDHVPIKALVLLEELGLIEYEAELRNEIANDDHEQIHLTKYSFKNLKQFPWIATGDIGQVFDWGCNDLNVNTLKVVPYSEIQAVKHPSKIVA
jgi:hypothetical protein